MRIEDKLIEKSIEAFSLAIEVYNKPSIKYRVEGFSLFICNAWELMLKAYLLRKGESIYYTDKPDRTLSLEACVKEVFTNDKDPLRLNLEKIIELRNTSTHYITEEYEMLYVPLFQSCILNFNEKMKKFHDVDMTDYIPQNFLTLSVSMKALENSEIIAKYPEEIANKLLERKDTVETLTATNNAAFAIRIDHFHYITKNPDKATSVVAIDSTADAKVKIIKELKNPNETHKYNLKNLCKEVNKRLKKLEIQINFNQYTFGLFDAYYDIKGKEKFCFVIRIYQNPQYSYSQQAIDFIVDEIKKNPENILDQLKKHIKK